MDIGNLRVKCFDGGGGGEGKVEIVRPTTGEGREKKESKEAENGEVGVTQWQGPEADCLNLFFSVHPAVRVPWGGYPTLQDPACQTEKARHSLKD